MSPTYRSRRARLSALSDQLRDASQSWRQIAAVIGEQEHVNARVAMRLAHGYTQAHVARMWNERWPTEAGNPGLSDKNVSYWETWPESGHEPSLKTLKRLAQLYQCDVGDLIDDGSYSYLDECQHGEGTALATLDARKQDREVPATSSSAIVSADSATSLFDELRILFAGHDVGPLLPYLHELGILRDQSPDSAQERERIHDQLIGVLSQWANTIKRRELLRLVGWTASCVAAAPMLPDFNPDDQQRVTRAITMPSRVDATAIDHIEAVLWHARRQDDLLGPQAGLHTVLSQRNVIRWILADCPSSLRPKVLSLLSVASRLAGWLSFDMGDYQGAWFYYQQARDTAHEARNGALGAQVLCNMSHLATWQGTPRLGIDYAVAAQGWAVQTDDMPLKAYAYQVAARAYAADGQERALHQMERAENCLSENDSSPSLAYFNDRALLVGDEALCHLSLGNSARAASASEEALHLADPSFVRNQAFTTLELGRARLLAGEVSEAARVTSQAVELAARNRSPRVTAELRHNVHALAQWRDVRAVKDLYDRCIEADVVDSTS